jgi:hypothetical protein
MSEKFKKFYGNVLLCRAESYRTVKKIWRNSEQYDQRNIVTKDEYEIRTSMIKTPVSSREQCDYRTGMITVLTIFVLKKSRRNYYVCCAVWGCRIAVHVVAADLNLRQLYSTLSAAFQL